MLPLALSMEKKNQKGKGNLPLRNVTFQTKVRWKDDKQKLTHLRP